MNKNKFKILSKNLELISLLKQNKINSSSLENFFLIIPTQDLLQLKKYVKNPNNKVHLERILDKKFSLENSSIEQKFCALLGLELEDVESFGPVEEYEFNNFIWEAESDPNYLEMFELIKKHKTLALTSDLEYLRSLAMWLSKEKI